MLHWNTTVLGEKRIIMKTDNSEKSYEVTWTKTLNLLRFPSHNW